MKKRKGIVLTDKEHKHVSDLENKNGDIGYLLEDIEELLNSKGDFDVTVPKKSRLRAKSRKVSRAIEKVYDAVFAAKDAQEDLEAALLKANFN
jgi:ElaB/YqjD/DUF883 family membrane-anchored ribosome-binding protein